MLVPGKQRVLSPQTLMSYRKSGQCFIPGKVFKLNTFLTLPQVHVEIFVIAWLDHISSTLFLHRLQCRGRSTPCLLSPLLGLMTPCVKGQKSFKKKSFVGLKTIFSRRMTRPAHGSVVRVGLPFHLNLLSHGRNCNRD